MSAEAGVKLNATETAALRAIADGRVPTDEKLRARLKRKGVIARDVLGDRRLYVTYAGRKALREPKP